MAGGGSRTRRMSDSVERVRGILPEGRVGEALVVVLARADKLGLGGFCPFCLYLHLHFHGKSRDSLLVRADLCGFAFTVLSRKRLI
jgi:hypothetical protein